MRRRTDFRQTKILFLTAEGAWSVAEPFLDDLPYLFGSTFDGPFVVRPISTALYAALPNDTDDEVNPYLTRVAEMFNAAGDEPLRGRAILAGGFDDTGFPIGPDISRMWVRPISDVLIRRVTDMVAQVRQSRAG